MARRAARTGEGLVLVERGEGEAGEDGEQEDLQDFAFGEGADEGVGDDVEEEVGAGELLAGSGVLGDGFGVEGAGSTFMPRPGWKRWRRPGRWRGRGW